MSRRRDQRYPLNQPPDGMVVEPALPSKDPMTPSQRSVNNSLATADEENLPPVTDAQGNPVPLDEFSPPDDAMVDPTPAEVRRATMSVPSKGVHFNFEPFQQIAQLHAAGQTDEARNIYNSLDPQSRYVYENIKNMKKVPAAEAARLADEFRQNQDRIAMQERSPAGRAAADRERQVERDKQDELNRVRFNIQRLDKYAARVPTVMGPKSGGLAAQVYDYAFNPADRTAREELMSVVSEDVLQDAKYVKPFSNEERTFLLEMRPGRTDSTERWNNYMTYKRQALSARLPDDDPLKTTPAWMQGQQQGSQPQGAAQQQAQTQIPPLDRLPPVLPDGSVLKKPGDPDFDPTEDNGNPYYE
jgi:hypothetical protein